VAGGVKEAAERLEKACQREKVQEKCLLVIMNNNNRSYGTVKYYGDLKCKLTTQCATQEKLIKEAKGDYAGNLVLKINTKVRAAAVCACDCVWPAVLRIAFVPVSRCSGACSLEAYRTSHRLASMCRRWIQRRSTASPGFLGGRACSW